MKTSFSNRAWLVWAIVLLGLGARADQEQDLIAILKSSASVPHKCSACQQLRVHGTVQSVPVLAAVLGEERLSHAARYALEGMPFPEAAAALRQALETTSGLIKVGLIDSIGWRRDAAALPMLAPLLANPDTNLASATAVALGKIAGPEARQALLSARDQAPAAVKLVIWNSLLQCAERGLLEGNKAAAIAIYRDLSQPSLPAAIRASAWRGLVLASPESRAELLRQALITRDPPIRRAALQLVRELNQLEVVQACERHWAALSEEAQLALLDAHVKLGTDALPAVKTATESPHATVRIAAWQALGDLGDPTILPALTKTAATADPDERAAARDALSRLRGAGVDEALRQHLDRASPTEQVELLKALGERGGTDAAGLLVQTAKTGSEPMRLAAFESLRRLAVAGTLLPLLDLTAKTKSDAEHESALRALFAVCQACPDPETSSRQVVDSLNRYPVGERRQVLPLLAELGTATALDSAITASHDPDPELAKEAAQVLAQWPNAAAAPRLLDLARESQDARRQTLALRGAIEVSSHEPDPTKRLSLLQQALTIAGGPEEKKQVLGQMGQIPLPAALQIVLANLGDASLAQEAGLAALNIAEKIASANPILATETADKVLAHSQAADLVKRAWALRGKPKGAGPFIQNWLVAGPYRQAGANDALSLFDVVFAPEKPDPNVEWKPVPRADLIDLSALFPNQTSCVAYLKTKILAPDDGEAALLLGSDDGVKAWLNGAVVHRSNVDRGAVADQDMAPIKLKQGSNDLLLKITQGGGGWAACARIVGTEGRPIAGLKYQTE